MPLEPPSGLFQLPLEVGPLHCLSVHVFGCMSREGWKERDDFPVYNGRAVSFARRIAFTALAPAAFFI